MHLQRQKKTRLDLFLSHTAGSHAKPNHTAWPLLTQEHTFFTMTQKVEHVKHGLNTIIWLHRWYWWVRMNNHHQIYTHVTLYAYCMPYIYSTYISFLLAFLGYKVTSVPHVYTHITDHLCLSCFLTHEVLFYSSFVICVSISEKSTWPALLIQWLQIQTSKLQWDCTT